MEAGNKCGGQGGWRSEKLLYICGGGFAGRLALPFSFYTTATLQIMYSLMAPIDRLVQ